MQKLADICIRRPVFASMLIAALMVIGVAGYLHLPVDRFPSVDLPTVRVITRLPGASPAEVESSVSQPIEEVLNTIEGIKELRSISGSASSFVIVTFELSRNVDTAAQDVRDRVATVVRDLPRDADPPVISKADNDLAPVMAIALSGERSLRELTELADKVVKIQVERAAGVGEVNVQGGLERAINVWVDVDRLAAYQLPITAVREAMVRQNANIPGGNVTGPVQEQSLRTMGRLSEASAFGDLVVATRNGAPVRIRDLGWAEDGTKEQRSLARLNGVPTVTLEVLRQSGANTVAVIEGVKARLGAVQAQLPADVKLEVIRDQSRYIYEALHEITRHLLGGSLLACLVVWLFMRDWRATVIAALAIPASVVATFGVMKAFGFTLNSVTMLALVLMVGVVIDDAIVVLENIFRFVEEKRMRSGAAARAGTAEIALPVMATTFSLVVIFVPVSFMSSISGRFLFQFGITAAAAVLVSLLVSFTLTPMMSARLLPEQSAGGAVGEARSRRGFYRHLERPYLRLLGWAMGHRLWVALGALGVMLTSVPLYGLVRQEYIPSNVDEGEFEVNVTAPEGASLPAMIDVASRIEPELRGIPGVRLVLASAGGGGFLGSVNNARFFVQLVPHVERVFSWGRLVSWRPWAAFRGNRSQREVMQDVRRMLGRKFPELRISVRNPQTFSMGGPNIDIDFSLLGPDLEALFRYAESLRLRATELGLQDADITLKPDKPEIRVAIDRDRAARLGVDTEAIADALRLMVGGDPRVSRFRDEAVSEDYDVELRLQASDRSSAEVLARLWVPRDGGGLVRLDDVVRLAATNTPSRIDRLDRQRQVSLRASVAPGYAQADRVAALRTAVRAMNLPPEYTDRVSGRARELETTFVEFLWAFLLSVILMYLILASQFESLVHPFTILLSLPLSVPFALVSLLAAGQTLNLYSALGILVLFGVVKKNAILQIDHMNGLRAQGLPRSAAILQGNRDRLRPILMTTFTLVAGMLPLALGTGPGAEERRATAIVVIGGQALCLLLTLIVTPVVYSLLDDLGQRFTWRRWRLEEEGAAGPAKL